VRAVAGEAVAVKATQGADLREAEISADRALLDRGATQGADLQGAVLFLQAAQRVETPVHTKENLKLKDLNHCGELITI